MHSLVIALVVAGGLALSAGVIKVKRSFQRARQRPTGRLLSQRALKR